MKSVPRHLLLGLAAYLATNSCFAFQQVALGTGNWWGEYSFKWAMLFFTYTAFCIGLVFSLWVVLYQYNILEPILERLLQIRNRMGPARFGLALLIFIAPIWFLQYTPWGIVFSDVNIRILIWFLIVLLLAFMVGGGNGLFKWHELLAVTLLTSSAFVIAASFMNVTAYPFSLSWSEGNRMWDYSIMFARDVYIFPADRDIVVFLDRGRQFVGGLPFVMNGVSIEIERFWLALTVVLPYVLFGLVVFRFTLPNYKVWLLGTLWVLIFLKQGPIHPPLVLCAVIVALVWRSPLWLGLPLIAVAGYLAEASRFTWVFAPGMWIGMLELISQPLDGKKITFSPWVRAISLALAGMIGGQFGGQAFALLAALQTGQFEPVGPATSVSSAVSMVSAPTQALLWYRLFPNETYGTGILIGLLIAVLPLVMILIYLAVTKKWVPDIWQILAMTLPLLAFFTVGLIISTKIGGGGDLHNMDMFLIGLVFIAVVAWEHAGQKWLAGIDLIPVWVKVTLLLVFALPGFTSLQQMRGYDFGEDIPWLLTLTDLPDKKFLEMYPTEETANKALATIREQVQLAHAGGGQILFMDQRQLLTFGYISGIPLIDDYEKKLLMQHALSSGQDYFNGLYSDLAAHRFALIVSEPLRTPIKDSSFEFGEENNAWVKWVAEPILCYYEPIETLRDVNVQLLVPKTEVVDCTSVLPQE